MDYLPEAVPAASSRSLRLQKLPVQIPPINLRHVIPPSSVPRHVFPASITPSPTPSVPPLCFFRQPNKLRFFLTIIPFSPVNRNPSPLSLFNREPLQSRSAAYLRPMTVPDRFACAGETRSRSIYLITRSVRTIFGSAIFCARLDRIP